MKTLLTGDALYSSAPFLVTFLTLESVKTSSPNKNFMSLWKSANSSTDRSIRNFKSLNSVWMLKRPGDE